MVGAVGTAVFVYAAGYLEGHPRRGSLYGLLVLFLVGMVVTVLADDVVLLFLGWELTSIASCALVAFEREEASSRAAARQALLVTGLGGLVLLVGLMWLAHLAGTHQLSALIDALPRLPAGPAGVGLALVVVGAFTKSAQVPFHFWLPNAMTAPTPVSALLHSATLVKLGVFLLARFDVGASSFVGWSPTLQIVGSVTAAWGMVLALRERDLKRILAWSTVATLGTLVVLVGLQGSQIATAALLLAHALYKAPLFFVAGNVDHACGTRVIDRLGNLRHKMPWTAAAAALAALSMAGLPFSFGQVAKEVMRTAKDDSMLWVQVAQAVFGAVAIAVAAVASVRFFWRHPGENITPPAHEGGVLTVVPPLLLGAGGLALGLFPEVAAPWLEDAARAMGGVGRLPAPDRGATLGTLVVTLGVGACVYKYWDPLHFFLERLAARVGPIGMARLYERVVGAVPRLGTALVPRFQHGHLPGYLALTALVATAALWLPSGPWTWPQHATSPGMLAACLLIAAGAVLAVVLRRRVVLVLGVGLVGYGTAVLCLFVGAPDLALTQLAVETIFVVVAVAVLIRLGARKEGLAEPRIRWGAAALALAFGGGVVALMLATTGAPADPALDAYFGAQSLPAAHGRNVVNVILVDFRAFDTLGEVAVVVLSCLAGRALLSVPQPMKTKEVFDNPVLQVVLRPLCVVLLVAAGWLWLRGHHAPGGGFVGGLVAAGATAFIALAQSPALAIRRLPLRSARRLGAAGVLLAGFSGLPALVVGQPYLTHLWTSLNLGFTELAVSTVMLFDAGVLLGVWGALAGYVAGLLSQEAA